MRQLLVGDSPVFAARLGELTGGAFLNVLPQPFPSNIAELVGWLEGAPKPDLALLAPGRQDLGSALALAEELGRDHGVAVILVTDHGTEVGVAALRAGVLDILDPAAQEPEINAALARAAALSTALGSQPAPATGSGTSRRRGRVVTVASPKGGVGKTTVSANLAVGLAKRAPASTVLVDLDIHFGDVASALNLTPTYTLPDMTSGAANDVMALKSLLALHETGLFVIAGSESPAAADAVTAAEVARLLDTLAEEFTYVVVDTAPGLSEHTLAVLDATDSLVLVTSLDVPGVRGLRKELDTLNELNMHIGSRHVVLNFFEPSRGLTVKDVEATIRTSVNIVLPQSKSVPISVNQGIPLLQQGDHREAVSRQLQALVDLIAPVEATVVKKGLFSRAPREKKDNAK